MTNSIVMICGMLLLLPTWALAQSQQVRVSVAPTTGGNYQASVYYQPSDGQKTTGLGIRVHYSSAVIAVNGTSQVLSGVTGLQAQADEANHDGNSATDTFLNAAWFELNGNWPASLDGEALLFRIDFSLKSPSGSRSVVFNVTRVSTANGYDLQVSNYQAALGGSNGTPGGNSGGGQGGNVSQAIDLARQALVAAQSTDAIKGALSDAINAITASAASADAGALADARTLANDAARAGVRFFGPQVNDQSDTEVRSLLAQNSAALRFALDVAPEVTGNWQPDAQQLGQAMIQRGLGRDIGARLAGALGTVHALDTINIGNMNAEAVLRDALGAGADISTDTLTGGTEIDLSTERYQGAVLAVRLVGDLLPAGLRFLADGRALLVHEGLAFELAPVAADLLGFVAAVERESFAFELRSDGAVELNLGGGERFSGAFAYDNLAAASGDCGAITFTEPQGAANLPAYAYGVTCANGAAQRVVPFVQDTGFFLMQGSDSSPVSVDRNTGIIAIPNLGQFKAGFFISPLNANDQVFLEANRNSDGLALRATDLNGDGRQDFLLYSQKGVQPIYAMAQ